MKFFHGTSTIFDLGPGDYIDPPSETGYLRESWRVRHQTRVFMTDSYRSASQYARKACAEYGGEPIVFEVEPHWESLEIGHNREYTSDWAEILKVVHL